MLNLINIPMATSVTFRKVHAQRDRRSKLNQKDKDKSDTFLLDKLTQASGGTDNGKGQILLDFKAVDLFYEECKSFDDHVHSLDREESRPKTVLDDVLSSLALCQNLVKFAHEKQGVNDVETCSQAPCLHSESLILDFTNLTNMHHSMF